METLVANVGGYVGLFLGYAILQTPVFVKHIFEWIKGLITKRVISSAEETSGTSHCMTKNVDKNMEENTMEHAFITLSEDINKVKQNVEDVEKMLISLKQSIQHIDQELASVF